VINPLAGLQEAAITYPWWVVIGLAVVAVACWLTERAAPTGGPSSSAAVAGACSARSRVPR